MFGKYVVIHPSYINHSSIVLWALFRIDAFFLAVAILMTLIFYCSFLALALQKSIGPTAKVSVVSEEAQYVAARQWVAGCFWHKDIWVCGPNGGYYDLAQKP